MSSIDTLLDNNAKYAASFSQGELTAPPRMKTAIVTCMDARLETGALLGLSEGDAHVLRNAGGAVTEDVIRSLTISQLVLGTREVMLIQHTDCGMTGAKDADLEEAIRSETGAEPTFRMETFTDLEENLRQSLARIEASPFVKYKQAVRAFVYDVETGCLREVK